MAAAKAFAAYMATGMDARETKLANEVRQLMAATGRRSKPSW